MPEIQVCNDCDHEVETKGCGTENMEFWNVCSGCGNVEQGTRYITLEEYDKIHG